MRLIVAGVIKRIQPVRLIVAGVIALALSLATGEAAAYDFPQAEKYKEGLNLADYYVTTLPVGLPAHWDGEKLIDDKGGVYQTPDWFIEHFPPNALDGVLSGKEIERIRRAAYNSKTKEAWQELRFIALDMPDADGGFGNRLQQLQEITRTSRHLQIARWDKLKNEDDLTQRRERAKQGAKKDGDKTGGGILLQLKEASYKAGGDSLLLAKPYEEDTAQVAGINYSKTTLGNMGSLDVIDKNGGQFIIDSGFSKEMRRNPPAKGDYIAYKYNGYTKTGKPDNPVFLSLLDKPPLWAQKLILGVIYPHQLTWVFLLSMLLLALADAISHRRNGAKMNFKSVIVSVGLLGTFVGIWWGLYNFESSNITGSVPILLDGLKLSFVTSITGIGLSVLLSIGQTIGGRQNTHDLSDLSADINRLADILEELKAKNPPDKPPR